MHGEGNYSLWHGKNYMLVWVDKFAKTNISSTNSSLALQWWRFFCLSQSRILAIGWQTKESVAWMGQIKDYLICKYVNSLGWLVVLLLCHYQIIVHLSSLLSTLKGSGYLQFWLFLNCYHLELLFWTQDLLFLISFTKIVQPPFNNHCI